MTTMQRAVMAAAPNRSNSLGDYRCVVLVSLALGLCLSGCKRQNKADDSVARAHKLPAANVKLELAAAGNKAFSPDEGHAQAVKGKITDYWKGVRFDIHNFEEVVDYVTTYYIEETPDTQRAWITAANNALALLTPSRELLPTAFFNARRKHVDEEGRLDGITQSFSCKSEVLAGVSLHKIPSIKYLKSKRKKRPNRRLTDDELRNLRNKEKARYRHYRAEWKKISFGRVQLRCAMDLVKQELKREKLAAPKTINKAAPKADEATVQAKRPGGAKGKAEGNKAVALKTKADKPAPPPAKVGVYEGSDERTNEHLPEIKPDMNRAWLAAAKAYLFALDPHSSVISRKAWDESTKKTENSSFEGIGARYKGLLDF